MPGLPLQPCKTPLRRINAGKILRGLHEASGSFVVHPERKAERALEPKPTGVLGSPPARLNAEEIEMWHEIAAVLPPGVAKNSDRHNFEMMVCLFVGFVHRRLSASEMNLLTGHLARFGMNPSDRSRLTVSDDNSQDPLEIFLSAKPTLKTTQ